MLPKEVLAQMQERLLMVMDRKDLAKMVEDIAEMRVKLDLLKKGRLIDAETVDPALDSLYQVQLAIAALVRKK